MESTNKFGVGLADWDMYAHGIVADEVRRTEETIINDEEEEEALFDFLETQGGFDVLLSGSSFI